MGCKSVGSFRGDGGTNRQRMLKRLMTVSFDPLPLPLMNETHLGESMEMSGRPPLSNTQYVILPLLAMALVVALRPSWPIRVGAVVLHVLWALDGTKYSAGGGYEDYLKGCFLGATSLMALYNLVLTDPMIEWRDKSRPNVLGANLPLWERINWIFCAACNNRGLGWSFEVPYVPPLPSYERLPFLKRRTYQLLWNVLLVDIAQTYQRINPVFSPGSTASMWSQGLAFGYLNLLARLITAWGMFNIPYDWLSLACVATGIHEPKDWPDTFGNWSDAYTVRRFWSRSWHQRLRRVSSIQSSSLFFEPDLA
ncbi:hypothetical protein BDY19DRAFT_410980 [Irpex rosettiformis]|uniref:Uncharacterized protein n=1 Tax=Irpex rosettiformis TaxID=378272 RepID=A0ACB8UFM8_9APHY|nr:hypothetical protein BDY19DRAFT_410980 [Irpex rosettiformis]